MIYPTLPRRELLPPTADIIMPFRDNKEEETRSYSFDELSIATTAIRLRVKRSLFLYILRYLHVSLLCAK
jgi:hypothetical protein